MSTSASIPTVIPDFFSAAGLDAGWDVVLISKPRAGGVPIASMAHSVLKEEQVVNAPVFDLAAQETEALPVSPRVAKEKRARSQCAACDDCRRRKKRCDGSYPCLNCERRGSKCTYIYLRQSRDAHRRLGKEIPGDDVSQSSLSPAALLSAHLPDRRGVFGHAEQ